MKLLQELLAGLKTPVESRKFTIDDGDRIYSYENLMYKFKLSRNDMEHVRYMKSKESRTIDGMLITRVDDE